MRITEKHVLFWGDWPSNWYPAEFDLEVNGKMLHFYNSEQYFMYIKAITFGDTENANKILATKGPKEAKAYGRLVKNYDDEKWNEMRYNVMLDANKAKYSQNKKLKGFLLSPALRDKKFVEASPLDNIWGIKLSEKDPDADEETKWKGQNLLGKAIDETRKWLLEQEKGVE
jgi:ribA/ribD-fused uncharacterized protein